MKNPPPPPCAAFDCFRRGLPPRQHWHWPAWAELAQWGDRPAIAMLLEWWPLSRRARAA